MQLDLLTIQSVEIASLLSSSFFSKQMFEVLLFQDYYFSHIFDQGAVLPKRFDHSISKSCIYLFTFVLSIMLTSILLGQAIRLFFLTAMD